MKDGSSFTRTLTLSYEQVGQRIQRIVAAPGVQKIMAVTVTRLEEEPEVLWDRVLADLEGTDGVLLERFTDGSVRIGWQKYIDG